VKLIENFDQHDAETAAINGATLGRTADAPGPDRGTVGCVAAARVANQQR
jgi:hypothetical protein